MDAASDVGGVDESGEFLGIVILAVKDQYTFDFLSLADEHSERDLEQALVKNVRSFLSEMGGAYAFIDHQYRLEVGGQEYFIDLLLFHRRLRCLVAIELKIGDFKLEHKGKMGMPDRPKYPPRNEFRG